MGGDGAAMGMQIRWDRAPTADTTAQTTANNNNCTTRAGLAGHPAGARPGRERALKNKVSRALRELFFCVGPHRTEERPEAWGGDPARGARLRRPVNSCGAGAEPFRPLVKSMEGGRRARRRGRHLQAAAAHGQSILASREASRRATGDEEVAPALDGRPTLLNF